MFGGLQVSSANEQIDFIGIVLTPSGAKLSRNKFVTKAKLGALYYLLYGTESAKQSPFLTAQYGAKSHIFSALVDYSASMNFMSNSKYKH